MTCSNCNDSISQSDSIRQSGEHYCSLECANKAAGYDASDDDGYYEEDSQMYDKLED